MKSNLYIIVLIPLFIACSSSKEVIFSSRTLDIWDILSYHPDSGNQLADEYFYRFGFSGEYLKLETDGTYYHKYYSHLYDPSEIIDGSRESYRINADTLFLKFESFQLKPEQGIRNLFAGSLFYSSMYSMLILSEKNPLIT